MYDYRVLLCPQCDCPDSRPPKFLESREEQAIGLLAPVGSKDIRGLEIYRVERKVIDKLFYPDFPVGFRYKRLKFGGLDDYVFSFSDFVSFDGILSRGLLSHPLCRPGHT